MRRNYDAMHNKRSKGCERIEREELLRVLDAAQCIAPDRDEPAAFQSVHRLRESLRQQDAALHRAAHRGDASDLVDRRPDDREIEPLVAADIAVEHLADMEAEIDFGRRQVVAGPPPIEIDKALASAACAARAEPQAAAGDAAVKIARVPSPISFKTSPPLS